jgi:hypothetical protein
MAVLRSGCRGDASAMLELFALLLAALRAACRRRGDLIARISRDNPLWGAERVRGELRQLGIAVSNRLIRRYRWCGPTRPPGQPDQTWRTFLRNHAPAIWAADLFTVQTLTFKTLYVLLFIIHGRRELVRLAVTTHPTAAWVWWQLVEATPWAAGRSTSSATGTASMGAPSGREPRPRHRNHPDPGAGAPCQRHRRARDWHAAPGMPRPRHPPRRAAPALHLGGARRLLQPGSAASHPADADAAAAGPLACRAAARSPFTPGPRWAAPRVRVRRLRLPTF